MKEMSREELLREAWSFSDIDPPPGSKQIDCFEKEGEIYYIYLGEEDGEPKIYYETERGYEIKRHMREVQNERRKPALQKKTAG